MNIAYNKNFNDLATVAEIYRDYISTPTHVLVNSMPSSDSGLTGSKCPSISDIYTQENLTVGDLWRIMQSGFPTIVYDDELIEDYLLNYPLGNNDSFNCDDVSTKLPARKLFCMVTVKAYLDMIATLICQDVSENESDIDDFLSECNIRYTDKTTVKCLLSAICKAVSEHYSADLLGADAEEIENLRFLRDSAISVFKNVFLNFFYTIYGTNMISATNSNPDND